MRPHEEADGRDGPHDKIRPYAAFQKRKGHIKEPLDKVGTFNDSCFMVVPWNLFNSTHENQHMITDHTEAVCNEHAPEQHVGTCPERLAQPCHPDRPEKAMEQSVIRMINVVDPHGSHGDGTDDIRQVDDTAEELDEFHAACQRDGKHKAEQHGSGSADEPYPADILH